MRLSDFSIPDGVLNQHMAVLGKTRSGKSSAMRLFVEYLLDRNERVCIIDPKGDWWGLKSSRDGKRAGYPVVIFGGSKADVPLNAHAGASVAELVATGNRPCVIDLGGWMVGERTRFFIDFASTLFRTTTSPLWLIIDEVHNFAPQGKVLDPDAGKMLHWANRLASEGAGKGIVIVSASQRPQKVHKDFLTCAETLVAMRVIHPLDRGAIKNWIDGCPDTAKGKEVLQTLASNSRGQGWVWSPEIGFGPKRVQFPMFSTYDSFAAPTGQVAKPLKGWAEVDLDDVRAKLAAVVEEAKANDPKELKREIAELKKQLACAKSQPDPMNSQKAIQAAVSARDREWQAALKERDTLIGSLKGRMKKAEDLLHVNGEAIPKTSAPAKAITNPVKTSAPVAPKTVYQPRKEQPEQVGDVTLGKAERAILTAFYWLKDEQATPAKIAFYSDYSAGSSTTNNALGRLRHGLVNGWQISSDGIALVESWGVRQKPSGSELLDWMRNKLGRSERAMLDALAESYPNRLNGEALSKASGYSLGSSTFNNAIGKLRTLEVAQGYERDGGTKAADVFFE